MGKRKKYLAYIKTEPDNPDPKEGQKGKVMSLTLTAYSLKGAIKKAIEHGEVIEVFAK